MGRRWSACVCIVTVSLPEHLQLHSPSRRVLGATSCVPRGQVAFGGTEAGRGHQGAVAPGGRMDGGLDTARDLLCLALGAPCLMLSAGLSVSPGWGSALSVSHGIFERPFQFCQSHSTGGETEAQKPDRGGGAAAGAEDWPAKGSLLLQGPWKQEAMVRPPPQALALILQRKSCESPLFPACQRKLLLPREASADTEPPSVGAWLWQAPRSPHLPGGSWQEASPTIFLPRPELALMCMISCCHPPGNISSKAEHMLTTTPTLSLPAPLPWERLSAGPWDTQQLTSLLCGCLSSGFCPQHPSAQGSPQPACHSSLICDSCLQVLRTHLPAFPLGPVKRAIVGPSPACL